MTKIDARRARSRRAAVGAALLALLAPLVPGRLAGAVFAAVTGARAPVSQAAPTTGAAAPAPALAGSTEPPALVLLLTIDQLRGDYLDRYAHHLEGGLARIRREAAYFPEGRQHHAVTSTAPGHASILSGRYPASTGIISNDSGVPDRTRPLLGVPDQVGASPHRFRGSALFDWLRAADPEARVLSVARKDRGAILPVGRARGHVYWYNSGHWTTSTYYGDTLPSWVRAHNARFRPTDWTGRAWELLLPESAYTAQDDWPFEGDGRGHRFPHRMSDDAARVAAQLERFPWLDSLTLDFALRAARELRVGQRGPGRTDLLVLGLSTLDPIGHDFGPQSREVEDHLVRVDRWLGAFLDSLHALVPREQMLLVLTADHGIAELPEHLAATGGLAGGRINFAPLLRAARRPIEARFATDFGFTHSHGLITANTQELRARGVDVDSLSAALAAAARELAGVARVFTPATLARAAAGDSAALLWRRSLPPTTGWLLIAVPEAGYIFSSGSTAQHGTLHVENMRVPIAFVGPGIPAGRHERVIETVDIAPTLAALLGIQPLQQVDGRVLSEVTGAAAAPPVPDGARHDP